MDFPPDCVVNMLDLFLGLVLLYTLLTGVFTTRTRNYVSNDDLLRIISNLNGVIRSANDVLAVIPIYGTSLSLCWIGKHAVQYH